MRCQNYLVPLFFLFILGLAGSSCNNNATSVSEETGESSTSDNSEDHILDKATFEAQMKKRGAVIVDVRMPQEFEQGSLEGAINIDFFSPTFKTDLLDLKRNKKYYLYCKNETRSFRAMKFMEQNDFKDVYILKGGFEEWNTPVTE